MKQLIVILLTLSSFQLFAEEIAKFNLIINKDRLNAPISISLDGLNYNTDAGSLALYEINSKNEVFVPSQLESGHSARLWFVLSGQSNKGAIRKFILILADTDSLSKYTTTIEKDKQDLCLQLNNKPVLKYRHAITLAPKEVDPLYKRSGYIHPLYSPGGEVLTRIQPSDHYHHYGIWGPWTKTHIDGRAVDFWNLILGEGTVKFSGFLSETEGNVYSGFKSLQQHIDFGAKDEDQIAMNEILDVRLWNTESDVRVIDYTTTLNCPLKNGILLDAYRYGGGIGYRATEKWHKDNCTVLTSEGKTRVDADGSNAKWCIIEGESSLEEGRSGILFLSHPSNRMHPEPMRVWPENSNNDRGDMYFEFVPIRHKAWEIRPNRNYTLKYRMIIFDGKMDAQTAEKYWNSFASQPDIEFFK